jgi:hypothetical protein
MTAFNVNVSNPGSITFTDKQDATLIYEMIYDRVKFIAIAEEKEITDERLMPVWGIRLTRVVLISKDKSLNGQYQVTLKRKLN